MTKTLTVNVWGPKPESPSMKLAAAGIITYREVPPFTRHTVPGVWAFAVDLDLPSPSAVPGARSVRQSDLTVGWLLGVLGVSKNVEVDYEVAP